MPKTTKKTVKEPILTVRIVTGTPTSAQKAMAKKFWAKLVSECKREVKYDR